MTREELKAEFLANPKLLAWSNAMDYLRDPIAEPKPIAAFDFMMNMAFEDTTLTTEYLAEMQAGDFSVVILDERFGVYLRNCLRHDLAQLVGETSVTYEQ